ncbi:hypothetical protein AB0L88_18035 [Saccharopolyspora shandongensis]|uniref:hypothetical protein n=1 Tax=Saccharopolyspora shandongensis TaxID=418495 RepID=UPI00342BD4EF
MTDSDRIAESSEPQQTTRPTDARAERLRPLLWLVLIISASTSLVLWSTSTGVLIGLGFGLLTALSGMSLIVHHYHHRRG